MLRATAAAKKDYSELSREWKWDSIISQDTRLPSDKSALVDEPFVDPHGPRASISGDSEVRFERKQQTHVSHDAFFPEKPEDWRIDVEDGSQAQVPINKLLDNLSLGLSQYSASEEDSKTLVSDKVQWHLDYEQEIPLAIKQHVLRYKQANDGPMRLERQLNGTEGVLCYILKHSLLIWLYRENTTLEQDFGEEIHSVQFTRLPPQLGVAGHPRCVLAVSLVSKLVFLTLTKVEEQFVLVRHVSFIHEQVDGMHFDYDLGRFFISCRGKDMLQEVVIDGNGNYRRHGCALSDMLDPKSMKLKPSFDSGTAQNIFGWIKHEFLGQNYTYKQHVFATSRKRTHLYHLETKMKGSDGLTDTLVDQTLSVYNISDNNFEYLGVLNIKDIFTESHKQNDRSTQQSKVETQTSKIVGIYTSYSKEWDLSLMYDNGYQKRLNVLFSNGSSGGSVSCKLYHYLGRSIEPYPSKTLGAGSTQDSLTDWNPNTLACQGYQSINSIVHKQVRGRTTLLMVENRLSLVPSASKYEPESRKINTVERVQTHSISCLLEAENYIDLVDSQLVFDINRDMTTPQSLFSDMDQSSSVLENPVVRDLFQGSLDLHDGLVVAFGDKLKFYRRLRISDLVYAILYHLDLAETAKVMPALSHPQAETEKILRQKNDSLRVLQKALRWDLILFGLKVRHQNLCAALLSIITNVNSRAFIISKGLQTVYSTILAAHDINPAYKFYSSTETHIRIRRVAARVLHELTQIKTESLLLSLSLEEPHILKPYILENQGDNQLLLTGERGGIFGLVAANAGIPDRFGMPQPKPTSAEPNALSYATMIGLSAAVMSLWRKPLFKHTLNGPLNRYFPQELAQTQKFLKNLASGLAFLQSNTVNSAGISGDRHRPVTGTEETRVLSVLKRIFDADEPLYTFGKGLGVSGQDRNHTNRDLLQFNLSADGTRKPTTKSAEIKPAEVGRWCNIAINVLALMANLSFNPVVLSRLDSASQHGIITQFIGDYVESEDRSLQLCPLILKLLEYCLEDQPLSAIQQFNRDGFEWTYGLLKNGEFGVLIDFVGLKRIYAAKEQREGRLELEEVNMLQNIVNRLKSSPILLNEHHIKEITPHLLKLDKLDIIGSILVGRLEYLNGEKAQLKEKIDIETKKLQLKKQIQGQTPEQPAARGPTGISIGFQDESPQKAEQTEANNLATQDNASASDQQIAALQSRFNLLDSEAKNIFNMIFSYLYEIVGLEKVEISKVELPSFLKRYKFLSYLWDLMYCNKKTVVRAADPQRRVPIVSKTKLKQNSILMQEFLARNKTDSRSVLVELLRQILTSNCTELRKSVIAWLVSIGQFSLIAEIDGEGTDKALTGNICEMLMTEDILEPKTAIDNLRFLVENLSTRKEWKATLKAIQLLLDNTHCLKINPSDTGSTDAANNTPKSFADRIHEVYNSFLGLKNSTNYLELSPDVITEYTNRLASLEGADNLERAELITKANKILKEQGASFGDDRARITRLFLDMDRSVRLQSEIIEELNFLIFQTHKILTIFSKLRTATGEPSTLCKLLYQQPEQYLNKSALESQSAVTAFQQRLLLFKSTLNSKIWSNDVIITRVIVPLSLWRCHISALFEENHIKGADLATKLEGLLGGMVQTNASIQTVHNLLSSADRGAASYPPHPDFFQHTTAPEVMDLLVDLQQSCLVWPANFNRDFTAAVRLMSKSQKLQGTDLGKVSYGLLHKIETVSLENPYNQLLHMEMNRYLNFHASGYIEPKAGVSEPMLRLYEDHDAWISSTALKFFCESFQVLPAGFNACVNLSKEVHLATDQYTPVLKDLQIWRLLIVTTKIFTSLMHSSNSQDKAWLAEQHKIANRVVNDLCLKANSSLVLSPEMKKYAKFVMIKVKAEWDEFRNKHVKRSPEFDSI